MFFLSLYSVLSVYTKNHHLFYRSLWHCTLWYGNNSCSNLLLKLLIKWPFFQNGFFVSRRTFQHYFISSKFRKLVFARFLSYKLTFAFRNCFISYWPNIADKLFNFQRLKLRYSDVYSKILKRNLTAVPLNLRTCIYLL